MTHAELVALAAAWLRGKHAVVITELTHGAGEEPDAIGFKGFGDSTLVECKASRSDFRADGKKWFRQNPALGMGKWRYMLAPEGVISADELPERWGLLKPCGRGLRVVKRATPFDFYGRAWEIQMLVSALRREDGVSVKRYTYETKCRATIGCDLSREGGGKG